MYYRSGFECGWRNGYGLGIDKMENKAAVIQFKADRGKVFSNLAGILSLCRKAAENKAKLIVLPEMCLTGYIWPNREDIFELTEKANGPTFEALSAFCEKNQIYLAYGFAEKDVDLLYNSQNLIGPNGKLLTTYRKVHLFEMDEFWAHPGDRGFQTIDTDIGRLGMGICMDLNFDDFVDFHIKQNTDYLLFSTNWLEEGLDVHSYWKMRLTGFENTVLMANTYGTEFNIEFCGRSAVFRNGDFTAETEKTGNQIILDNCC